MRFASEDVRHKFHSLPAAEQYEWVELDESLANSGEMLLIESVNPFTDTKQSVQSRIVSADGKITSER